MIEFQATYFDGKTSRSQPVTISFDGLSLKIRGEAWFTPQDVPLRNCTIDPPLGKGPRAIKLPDGALCETDDLSAVEEVGRRQRRHRGMRFVHLLESRWKSAVACLLLLLLSVAAFILYGVPLLAARAADSVPQDLMEKITRQTLGILDKQFLEPSELSQARMSEIDTLLKGIASEVDPRTRYQLGFRKGGPLGPNAFALPSGLILVTDELVALSCNDRELAGLLVHEITHVKRRHALRHILQSTGVFVLIATLAGDIVSITSLAASLPAVLIESGYSRKFEAEADREAGLYLIKKGWGTKPYRDLLGRLAKSHPEHPGMSLFSTHPRTAERIEKLRDLEIHPDPRSSGGR